MFYLESNQIPSYNEQENRSSSTSAFRQVSVISEEPDESTEPSLHQSNYSLDFHQPNEDKISKTNTVEQNIKGLVDGCVRSSLHQISYANREPDSKFILN